VARPAQRRAQGALFLLLSVFFAGIAVASFEAEVWIIAVAGGVLGLWMAGLAIRMLWAAR
jgi:succinate-acetate transporter protein